MHQLSPPLDGGWGASTSAPHVVHRWQHPIPGRYKCNIDAAFSSSLKRTGIDICVHDTEGIFVLAKTVTYPCLVLVDVGLHSALQWLSDMQFDSEDFETDSKMTSDAFLFTKNDTSEFGCLFHLVVLSLLLSFLTLGWSLLGYKPTWLLMLLQEKPHY